MMAVANNRRVTVRSGHSVGKTAASAWLTLWFLLEHNPALVVTTAPTDRQVRAVLWHEIRKYFLRTMWAKQRIGEILQEELRLAPDRRAMGFTTNEPDKMQGLKCANMLVIVDEASGILPDIYEAIFGLLTGARAKLLLIGNPLQPSGVFYESHRPGSPYKRLHISSLESPNIIAGEEVVPGLASIEWLEERKQEWREDSPTYHSRVLGEFPEMSEDVLIPLAWCEAALGREYPEEYNRMDLWMGADIARRGGDRIVLLIRDSLAVRHIDITTHRNLMETTGRVIRLAEKWGIPANRVYLDDGGMGGGVTDRLRELDFSVSAIDFSGRACDANRFANIRAESYWFLRDALDPRQEGIPLAIPKLYSKLAEECTMAHRGFTSKGQILLEKKKEIKKRLGRSPDLADALALTYVARKGVDIFVPGARSGRELQAAGRVPGSSEIDRSRIMNDEDAWL